MNTREILNLFDIKDAIDLKRIYKWSPVFQFRFKETELILKKTKQSLKALDQLISWEKYLRQQEINIVTPYLKKMEHINYKDENWILYPFINGDRFSGSISDYYQSGVLLGNIHSHSKKWEGQLPAYSWPGHDRKAINEDVDALGLLGKKLSLESKIEPLVIWLEEHIKRESSLKALNLPFINAVWDYKANNLIFVEGVPFLIDPDNAGYIPRVFDLALALILFNNEIDSGSNLSLTKKEFQVFMDGYCKFSNLTELEKTSWNDVLKYIYVEEAVWALLDNDSEAWASETQGKFLNSLLSFPSFIDRYSLM